MKNTIERMNEKQIAAAVLDVARELHLVSMTQGAALPPSLAARRAWHFIGSAGVYTVFGDRINAEKKLAAELGIDKTHRQRVAEAAMSGRVSLDVARQLTAYGPDGKKHRVSIPTD